MRYLKNEEPLRIIFILSLLFISYNFILRPLSQSVYPGLAVPALRTEDFFSNLKRRNKALPERLKDIVIVSIGNDSLKRLNQKWPWKRSSLADLVNKLSAYNPKIIYLDLAFLGKSEDESQDTALAEALINAKNVILASYIDEEGEYIRPLEKLARAARCVGLVNKKAYSQDFMVRKMLPVVFSRRGGLEVVDYGVEIKILALASGVMPEDISYESGRILLSKGPSIPLDKNGLIPINYSCTISDLVSIPACQILENTPPVNAGTFKNKIVLVGMTANIAHDIHPTPLGSMPGVYVIANGLLMLLSGNFVNTLPDLAGMFIILLFSFSAGLLSLRLRTIYSTLIVIMAMAVIAGGYLFLETRYNFRMDIFGLLFLTLSSYLAVELYKYITLIIESEALKNLSVMDPAGNMYTQRYFQVCVQSALQKPGLSKNNFFCLMRINEFPQLASGHPQALGRLFKMLAAIIRRHINKKLLVARYGEDVFSFVVWNRKKGDIEKLLTAIAEEIAGYEFRFDDAAFRISVAVAGLNFKQEQIKNYEDLVLTCEPVLKRACSDKARPLAIFDPAIDRIINSAGRQDGLAGVIPKDELSYVSMDLRARNQELEGLLEELKKQQKKVAELCFNAMHSLVRALEEKDRYTAGHSERVASYAEELARALGLSSEEAETIRQAAYLHDIGKIGIPDRVLHKDGRLDEAEYELIKRHQADGIKILEGLPFYDKISPYILYHHERYDGNGYPYGLSGDMIPRGAQIIAIADSFDAMTTGRGYNKPFTLQESIDEFKKNLGIQFHPTYMAKFIQLLEEKKIHAL